MKRKDFLKACLALGVVPFLPKLSKGKEKLSSKVYGMGYRQKNGVCYGFWHEDKGQIEMVFLDYQKIPYDKKLLGSIPPHYGKPTDSLKKKKEYYADDKMVSKLYKMQRRVMKEKMVPETTKEAETEENMWKPRISEWTKWFSNQFDKK